MKTRLPLFVLLAALVLSGCMFGGFLTAEDKVEKTFDTTGAPTVILETFNGSITVQGNNGSTVDVEITRRGSGNTDAEAKADLDNVLVETSQDGNTIHVTIRRSDIQAGNSGASVEVRLPQDATLELATSNGSITVEDVQGNARLSSSNGHIEVTSGKGELNLSTSNGSIDVNADEAVVKADTSNGSISFTGSLAPGNSTFNTSNAHVELNLPANTIFALAASTSNANVSCDFALSGGSQGDTYLNGSNGDFPAVHVNISTSNGNIAINKR